MNRVLVLMALGLSACVLTPAEEAAWYRAQMAQQQRNCASLALPNAMFGGDAFTRGVGAANGCPSYLEAPGLSRWDVQRMIENDRLLNTPPPPPPPGLPRLPTLPGF